MSPPQISEAATENRFCLEKMVWTEFVRTILAKSDDQFGHLVLSLTFLPDDVIAQRIGQLRIVQGSVADQPVQFGTVFIMEPP